MTVEQQLQDILGGLDIEKSFEEELYALARKESRTDEERTRFKEMVSVLWKEIAEELVLLQQEEDLLEELEQVVDSEEQRLELDLALLHQVSAAAKAAEERSEIVSLQEDIKSAQ